jgi:hypothetical protein
MKTVPFHILPSYRENPNFWYCDQCAQCSAVDNDCLEAECTPTTVCKGQKQEEKKQMNKFWMVDGPSIASSEHKTKKEAEDVARKIASTEGVYVLEAISCYKIAPVVERIELTSDKYVTVRVCTANDVGEITHIANKADTSDL